MVPRPSESPFQKGLACCNEVLPLIEWLERIAAESPGLQDRVQELRDRREHLYRLCDCALTGIREMR